VPSNFRKRIFFGHQSVGSNILDGIGAEFPDLPVVDVESEPDRNLRSGIFHARIGRNGDAQSKFESFSNHVLSPQREYDLALMKLCYVDIDRHSDVDKVFSQYVDTVERLQVERPDTKLVHTTVPLRVIRLGVRSYLKKWTGRPIDPIEDNSKRHLFNESLRQYFGDSHPVFDLAILESTTPSGDPSDIKHRGVAVPVLFPGYTTDGGHLNELGKSIIARQFISMLQTA
jgi:hypothetical protein